MLSVFLKIVSFYIFKSEKLFFMILKESKNLKFIFVLALKNVKIIIENSKTISYT